MRSDKLYWPAGTHLVEKLMCVIVLHVVSGDWREQGLFNVL